MWDRQVAAQAATASQYYASDPARVAEQMRSSIPLRRCGTADEVAGVVAFLLSDAASYLTGINVEIAGGSV
jgi:NAD(P)-dependent dehydrogenase (short-subunit alcohol dehydrogenase family)